MNNALPATLSDLNLVFGNVLKAGMAAAGLVVFAMLLVGGFQYLTAGGDKEAAQKAGKTLTFAITGFIVVIVTWLVFSLLNNFLGLDLTKFDICLPGQVC